MTNSFDDLVDTAFLPSPVRSHPAAALIRRLRQQATHARSQGQEHRAAALFRDAHALEAATLQYERAIADARQSKDDLQQAVTRFWDDLADDRTLHDLADDTGVFFALLDDLDCAESRLLTLEFTRP